MTLALCSILNMQDKKLTQTSNECIRNYTDLPSASLRLTLAAFKKVGKAITQQKECECLTGMRLPACLQAFRTGV
jgi:hypothetical protein